MAPKKLTGEDARTVAELAAKLGKFVPLPQCIYRDDKPYSLRPCTGCTKTIDAPTFKCYIHRRCTLTVVVSGFECCAICKDRKEPQQ